jgi:hypothetical protein
MVRFARSGLAATAAVLTMVSFSMYSILARVRRKIQLVCDDIQDSYQVTLHELVELRLGDLSSIALKSRDVKDFEDSTLVCLFGFDVNILLMFPSHSCIGRGLVLDDVRIWNDQVRQHPVILYHGQTRG